MQTQQEFDIKKYLQLLYRKRYIFAAIAMTITSAVIAFSYYLPKVYEAKSTVLIERNFIDELIKGASIRTPSIDDRTRVFEAMMKSRYLIRKVIDDLGIDLTGKSDAQVEKILYTFQKLTDINTGSSRSDMEMFTVSFKSQNPTLARDYVNFLVRRYIEDSLSHNRDETYGANKLLMEQINQFKEKISSIEADIARMSKQQYTVSRGGSAQERMRALEKQLDELRLHYTDNHPEIIKIKNEMESLKNDNTKEQGTELLVSRPSVSVRQTIASLQHERDTYQKLYDDLLTVLGRSEVSSRIGVQDKGETFKIIEPAILPIKPVSPDRVKIILLGLFAGIGGGVGFIILLDYMDKSIKTLDTLKTFGLPVLAVIPHIENPADIRKTRRNNILLYITVGVYLMCVAGLLSFEFIKKVSQ